MVEAHINLSALRDNATTARLLAPNSAMMAVIKADAYGHGLVPVARALQPLVQGFAVARWTEARRLRVNGIHRRLLVLSSLPDLAELQHCSRLRVDVVVHDPATIALLAKHHLPQAINVWLKADTGMHRLGLPPASVAEAYYSLKRAPSVKEIVLMSHFASADEPDNPFTETQRRRLEQLMPVPEIPLSMANSAAIIGWQPSHRDWIRPGIMLYGANPLGETATPRLQTVMTLRSKLLARRLIDAGESVGYNQTWLAPRRTVIGTVAAGYGDGYPRHAGSGTPVLINGRRVPLAGRVSMDTITVDLGPDAADQPGDEVMLWGEDLPVNEVARCAGTISYELFTRLTPRVDRVYSTLPTEAESPEK